MNGSIIESNWLISTIAHEEQSDQKRFTQKRRSLLG